MKKKSLIFWGLTTSTAIYPQKFIRFPSYGPSGGGSRPPVATDESLMGSLEAPIATDGGNQ
jgi:hypothetical protein